MKLMSLLKVGETLAKAGVSIVSERAVDLYDSAKGQISDMALPDEEAFASKLYEQMEPRSSMTYEQLTRTERDAIRANVKMIYKALRAARNVE